jgi:hypothetical protein
MNNHTSITKQQLLTQQQQPQSKTKIKILFTFLILTFLFLVIIILPIFLSRVDTFHDSEFSGLVSIIVAILPFLAPFIHLKWLLIPYTLEAMIAKSMVTTFLVPSPTSFIDEPFTTPDYGNLEFAWNAHPFVGDSADRLPPHCGQSPCSPENQLGAPADLFHIGPSTFYSPNRWNTDWNSSTTRYLIREAIIPQQAMIFNSIARVFSPQIRQMTGFAYFAEGPILDPLRQKAANIAYGDVRAAFRYYLQHWGSESRPIILAGHSQGAEYILRLLRDEFSTNPSLKKRFIVAYALGMPIFKSRLPSIGFPICRKSNDINCIVTWQTYESSVDPFLFHFEPTDLELRSQFPREQRACVNPLLWDTSLEYAPPEKNKGGMHILQVYQNLHYLFSYEKNSSVRVDQCLLGLKPNIVGAQCTELGTLSVDTPPAGEVGSNILYTFFPAWRIASFPGGSWHPYDFNFFWADMRSNAEERVLTFTGNGTFSHQHHHNSGMLSKLLWDLIGMEISME